MPQISLREAVDRAVEIEGNMAKLYDRASQDSVLPDSKDLFARLAKEERDHQEKLRQCSQGLGASGDDPIEFDEEFETSVQTPWPSVTPHNVHVYAIKNEYDATRFYRQLADSVANGGAKGVFEELAQAERAHRDEIHKWFDGIDDKIPKRET